MYLVNHIRPNIAYAISRISLYTSNPSRIYRITFERVFRYLKGTILYCLKFVSYPVALKGYSDAN